jgi:hypothetical protein
LNKLIGILVAVSGLGLLLKDAVVNQMNHETPNKRTNLAKAPQKSELLKNMDADAFQTQHPQLVACSFNTCE